VNNIMHSAYHTLLRVASDLAERLPGLSVTEVYSQERDEFVLAFGKPGLDLLVSCDQRLNTCFLHPALARAQKNSADVLPGCVGKTVLSVVMSPTDRVLRIDFAGGYTLQMLFFGARSNVLLLDSTSVVLDAFKHARELVGTAFAPPAPRPTSGTGIPIGNVPPGTLLTTALQRSFPQLPSVVRREGVYRSGNAINATVDAVESEGLQRVCAAVEGIMQELAAASPRVLLDAGDAPLHFSLCPLHHVAAARELLFENVQEALHAFYVRARTSESYLIEKQRQQTALVHRLERLRRSMAAMEEDRDGADRADLYQQRGAWLMQHLHAVAHGASQVAIAGDDAPEIIPLIPTLSAVQNAQRYFEKAKRARRARLLAEERLQSYAGSVRQMESLLDELTRVHTRRELNEYMKRNSEHLQRAGAGDEQDEERRRFRVFTVEGGFEVWAGKSSEENDELTLRHARPEDLWFHARGAPGSHVILKVASASGNPGKRARLQAAAIAAYYSKMRTARLVPVAVTKRKYVHKPKGAKAGSVVLQREEVLIVEPGLPPGALSPTNE
jgi:predicted ribosome quality control (RQC) complex YloA/Tae2 family protein